MTDRLNRKNDPDFIEEYVSKFQSLLASLALIFEIINRHDNSQKLNETFTVGPNSINLALKYLDFNELHIIRLINPIIDKSTPATIRLAEKIYSRKIKDGIKLRTIYRSKWKGLKDRHIVMKALMILEEKNWIRLEEIVTGGRPSEIIRINPEIIKNGCEKFIDCELLQ